MFGKGKSKKSANDRFVMAAGRSAGNLKFPGSRGGKGGSKGKASPDPVRPRTLKVGKLSGFDAE